MSTMFIGPCLLCLGSFCLGKPDNFYPSRDSCDHYYICTNQSAIQATCPYGLLYSPTKQYCDLRSRVSCLPGQTVPPYTTRALPSRWLKPTTATSKPTQLPASTSSGKSAISTLPPTTLNPGTAYSCKWLNFSIDGYHMITTCAHVI